MKGVKTHPVGRGCDSKEEFENFLNLLDNMGLVRYSVKQQGQKLVKVSLV